MTGYQPPYFGPEIFGQVGHVEQLVGEFERVVVRAHDDVRAAADVGGDCRLRTNVIPAFGVNADFDACLICELLGVCGEAVELRLDELLPAQHSDLSVGLRSRAIPGWRCLRRTRRCGKRAAATVAPPAFKASRLVKPFIESSLLRREVSLTREFAGSATSENGGVREGGCAGPPYPGIKAERLGACRQSGVSPASAQPGAAP